MEIRLLSAAEYDDARALILEVFDAFVAPD